MVEDTVKLVIYTVLTGIIIAFVAAGMQDLNVDYARVKVGNEIDKMMTEIRVYSAIPGKEITYVLDVPSKVHSIDFIPEINAGTLVKIKMDGGMTMERWYDGVYIIADKGNIPLRPLNGLTLTSGKNNLRIRMIEDPFSGKVLSAVSGEYPVVFRITGVEAHSGVIRLVLVSPESVSLTNHSMEIYINGLRYPYPVTSLKAEYFDFSNHSGYQYTGGKAFSGVKWKRGEVGLINMKNGVITPGDRVTVLLFEDGRLVGKDEVEVQ